MNKDDADFFDRRMADTAIGHLRAAKNTSRPFFLAVGIRRPHTPWRVPARWKEHYANVSVGLPTQPTMDPPIPDIAWSNEAFDKAKLEDGKKIGNPGPRKAFPDDVVTALRRGYYAAVSWCDEQVGRVLDELEALGLSNDTLVAIHGDHGAYSRAGRRGSTPATPCFLSTPALQCACAHAPTPLCFPFLFSAFLSV